jgi:hypothetical protein
MLMSAGALFWIGVVTLCLFIFLLNQGISAGVETRFKQKQKEIEREKEQALATGELQKKFVADMRLEFDKSYVGGRTWLISLIAEAVAAGDEQTAHNLARKSRPALIAAAEVRRIKGEKRALTARAMHFEYLLAPTCNIERLRNSRVLGGACRAESDSVRLTPNEESRSKNNIFHPQWVRR